MGKIIKIYGERNTGTNYLQQLIKLNFNVILLRGGVPDYANRILDVLQLIFPSTFKFYNIPERIRDKYFVLTYSKNLGWKHTMVSFNVMEKINNYNKTVFFITLTKNPYSWLLSLYNRPYHKNKEYSDFEHFLIEPWEPVLRENQIMPYKNPMDMWNQKNKSYIKLKNNAPTINMKYEDLLSNPEKVMERISEQFNLVKKHDNFQNIKKSTKENEKDFDYYQNYYLKEIWKKKLNDKTIAVINNYLDDSVMNYFGYKKIEK